jgi:hypothetical protein
MKKVSRLFYFLLLAATACRNSDSGVSLSSDTGKTIKLTPPKPDVTGWGKPAILQSRLMGMFTLNWTETAMVRLS